MAILKGAIQFVGSMKSIRAYRNINDSKTYVGEKGGANRDLIMSNPAFKRTRENMSEFGGCNVVKAIRKGFDQMLPKMADPHFTGRLVKLVKQINLQDTNGLRGRKSILFSACHSFLSDIVINNRFKNNDAMLGFYRCSQGLSRNEATVSVNNLRILPKFIPGDATHYRVLNHLSIISDHVYDEGSRVYQAVSELNEWSAFVWTPYTSIFDFLTTDLVAAFPADMVITDDCTVIQCVSLVFYTRQPGEVYSYSRMSFVKVVAVF
jgi:hypothetical protein